MIQQSYDLNRQVAALKPIHREIRSLCETLGLDVSATDSYARSNNLPLPWHHAASPELCLVRTRKVLKERLPTGENVKAIHDRLSQSHSLTYLLNLIAVVASTENKNWEYPAKAAFIRTFTFSAYKDFLGSYFEIDTEESARAAFHGELCWLVHDLQVFHALDSSGISDECKQVFTILENYLVNNFTQRIRLQALLEENEAVNFKHETEVILYRLAKLCTHIGPEVSALVRSLNTTDELPIPEIQLYDELERLYPDPTYPPNLEGEFVASKALRGNNVYAVLARINEVLREPITSRMEWWNPLGAAADQIRRTEVTDLSFPECDLLTTAKAHEVLLDLLSRVPNVKLVISVREFFPRGPDDPTYQTLASELNHFIETDLPSRLVGRSGQPGFHVRKDSAVAFIRAVILVVGRKNIEIVTPEQADGLRATESQHTCLIGASITRHRAENEGRITIDLRRSEPDMKRIVRLQGQLEDSGKILLGPTHCLTDVIVYAVVPSLSGQKSEKDQHGLNGVRPEEIALHLSGRDIPGLGKLPEFSADVFCLRYDGTYIIKYTGKDDDGQYEIPSDAEGSAVGDGVESEALSSK